MEKPTCRFCNKTCEWRGYRNHELRCSCNPNKLIHVRDAMAQKKAKIGASCNMMVRSSTKSVGVVVRNENEEGTEMEGNADRQLERNSFQSISDTEMESR